MRHNIGIRTTKALVFYQKLYWECAVLASNCFALILKIRQTATLFCRVSSAKGVHLAGILLPVTKTEKCTRCVQGIARYQIWSKDKGWGWDQLLVGSSPPPSFWWWCFQGGFGIFLVSTFVEGTGWLIQCNWVWPGAKNNELFLPGGNVSSLS